MVEENINNEEVEITPGTSKFNKMVFKIVNDVNAKNLGSFSYNGNELQEIQPGVYSQPAYVDDTFNLFFVITQLIEDDWLVAFSTATIKNGSDIVDLSEPLPTGKGINMVGDVSPNDANNLLMYFNTLTDANRGEWRLLE